MKMCLDEYKRQLAAANNIKELVNKAEIARMFGISPSTLHHRVSLSKSSYLLDGWQHASGGKRCPHVLKTGKRTPLQVLLHLFQLPASVSHQTGLPHTFTTCDHFDHPKSVYILQLMRMTMHMHMYISECWLPSYSL